MKFTERLQDFRHDELHRFPCQEQPYVYFLRGGMFPILSTPPQSLRANSPTPIFRPHVLVNLPCYISTVQSSGRDLLLLNHRPVGSRSPHGPGRNLGRVRPYSSLANGRVWSGCRLIPPNQGSAGCVCERVEGFPHRGLRGSRTGMCKLICQLTEDLPVLPFCLYSYVRGKLVGHRHVSECQCSMTRHDG